MSRFESLEFDEPKAKARAKGAEATGTPIRDAAYFRGVADKEFLAGHIESALRNYSRALEQDNALFPCWLGQVRSLIELQEYKEADLWSDKALELFPEHPELLAAKAVAMCRMGMLKKALAFSDNAVTGKGATPFVWVARGEVLLQRKSKMAEHCFSQAAAACEGRESQALVQLDIARTLRHYRRFSQALAHATEAVQGRPRSAAAWLEQGLCQAALGLRDARTSLAQVLQLDATSVRAREALKVLDQRGACSGVGRFFRRLFGR